MYIQQTVVVVMEGKMAEYVIYAPRNLLRQTNAIVINTIQYRLAPKYKNIRCNTYLIECLSSRIKHPAE